MQQDDTIISRFCDAPGTIYEVVEADQVPHAGYRGFGLAAVLYEDRLVVPEGPQRSYNPSYPSEPAPVAQPAVVLRQARYLMRKDAESALCAEREARLAAEELLREARTATQEAVKTAAFLDKEIARLRLESQTLRDNSAALGRNRDADLAAKRRFEADIAKLRVALGDLRMKEILGS